MDLPIMHQSSAVYRCPMQQLSATKYLPHRTYYPVPDYTYDSFFVSNSSYLFNRPNDRRTSVMNCNYGLNGGSCNLRLFRSNNNRSAFQTWCSPNRSFQRQKLFHEPYESYSKKTVLNNYEEILLAVQNEDIKKRLPNAHDNYYTRSLPRRMFCNNSSLSRTDVEKNRKVSVNAADSGSKQLFLPSLKISLQHNLRDVNIMNNCRSVINNIDNDRKSIMTNNNDVINTSSESPFSSFNTCAEADYAPFFGNNDGIIISQEVNRSVRRHQQPNSCSSSHQRNNSCNDACYSKYFSKNFCCCNNSSVSTKLMDNFVEERLDKPGKIASEVYLKTMCDKYVPETAVETKASQVRIKPPLPPNPPSRSRILRYSHSVNSLRKQVPPVLSLSSVNPVIDAFQECEQKRNDPRMRPRVAGPGGGYGPQGRTGITAAGTGPNVSGQMAMSASSKKKKSKKEKKSKLRKADISNPTNFTHKAHIGWDASGGFSQETYDNELMDNSVRDLLRAAGENPDRMTKDELDFTYRFLHQYQKSSAAPATPARKGQKPPGKQRPPPPQQPAGGRPPEVPPSPPESTSNLPPIATNAPPPPPPPPVVARPPPTEDSNEGGDLSSQIRTGGSLKTSNDSGPAPAKPASRDDVLAQIRQGKVLKSVDKAALEQKKEANLEDIGGIAGALAKALKDIREKVHDSEESSEEDDENNDDEWESD
uniref:CRIB domain-containing protein n=1 Tax=Syphacia muris TaxID=451379 RepID=A0A0N5AQC2_9BILA